MSLIDIRCTADPTHLHEVSRSVADWPATPACPDCGAETEQAHVPPRTRHSMDAIVVFQAQDGSFRFPGDLSGPMTQHYRDLGYTEVALRSATEVRRFESHINKGQREQDERRCEHRERQEHARSTHMRGELRRLMPGMTRYGRDLARGAMERNDDKPRERPRDGGFHVEALSFDHSNRMESRDADGRRRRD